MFLGSAIATHMLCHIQGKMNGPSALILESPFTNFYEEIYAHKFSLVNFFLKSYFKLIMIMMITF